VRAAVAALGRTEDVKFSPSNRRLAVAGFGDHKISVFDVSVKRQLHSDERSVEIGSKQSVVG
jgi:hypothetical protein